jgi:hypothetical protein
MWEAERKTLTLEDKGKVRLSKRGWKERAKRRKHHME